MASDRLTVYTETGDKLVLGPNDHLATGGEGAVYARQDTVFKVYLDPAKAQRARLSDKVLRLKQLQHPGIAAPTGVLTDKHGAFLGMTFPRVPGEALCKLFTNTWRDAHQFGADQSREVALRMRDIVMHAHAHQALLVDGNELNWLVEGTRPTVIDVDSWQLPGYPATAIMPSVRDPLAVNGFTEGSDWFTWAIVTFQLWTGIHPYKGTHPDFPRHALEARMKAQASVFDAKVSLPAAARSVQEIPGALRQWYQDVFSQGLRGRPPAQWTSTPAAQTAPRLRVRQGLSGALKQERLGSAPGRVVAAFSGFVVARAPQGLLLWDTQKKAAVTWVTAAQCENIIRREAALVRLPQGEALVQLIPGQSLELWTAPAKGPAVLQASLPTRACRLWQSGTRVFALVEGVPNGLVELAVTWLGSRLTLSIAQQWPVSALSTQFLRGALVQDCLGAAFIAVLEGAGLVQYKAPGLSGYRVLDGLGFDRHNVWLLAVRKRDGETVRMRWALTAQQFECVEEDLTDEELDGASLASGVSVLRLGPDLRVAKGASHKVLPDCGLPAQARLFSLGTQLGLFEDTEVSRLSLG